MVDSTRWLRQVDIPRAQVAPLLKGLLLPRPLETQGSSLSRDFFARRGPPAWPNKTTVPHEIKYEFRFMKRGPEPSEFCDCLASKMDSFIATINLSEPEEKSMKCAISIVTKRVCIRQNITDPTRLDRRRYANQLYRHRGVLPDHNESPQKAAEDSSGRQGVVKFTKTTHANYKANQDELLTRLDRFFESNESYNFGSPTEEFCNYIDQHTLSIIKLPVDSISVEILDIMLDLCEYVVMGRFANDWARLNNFVTASGWNNWRKHMCVLISFAAMLTALFMALSTLKRSRIVATYSCSCRVGLFLVFVTTSITIIII